jgi:hypothetical protein
MANKKLVIHKAVKADVPAMQQVFRRSFLVGYGWFVPWQAIQHWVTTDMGGKLVETEWETFAIAEREGQVVGIVQVKGNFIHELWVDPNQQRQGY